MSYHRDKIGYQIYWGDGICDCGTEQEFCNTRGMGMFQYPSVEFNLMRESSDQVSWMFK